MRRNDSGSGTWPARVACDSSHCEGKSAAIGRKGLSYDSMRALLNYHNAGEYSVYNVYIKIVYKG